MSGAADDAGRPGYDAGPGPGPTTGSPTEPVGVWAPLVERVVVVAGVVSTPLARDEDGWHRGRRPAGVDYAFQLDGEGPYPDPRSRHQPEGVHGPTRPFDPASVRWSDQAWRGVHLPSAVIYELHVGTFSPEGTFDGAIAHLDHLVDLGVDVVEVMPVAAFSGERGWGYDGVLAWAVHAPYGGPAGLCRFVDACHARGLGVLVDVVHNHFGPEGNYHSQFGPYFTDAIHTPWGDAINLDGPGSPEVRAHLIGSALWLLEHAHLDGLRLDAVHALFDRSSTHYLEELSSRVDALSAHLGRPLWLVAETDRADPRTVTPRAQGGDGLDAMWADDLHHAVHSALTGERDGYYADFGSTAEIAEAIERVFVPDGGFAIRWGRPHGRPIGATERWRFVGCLQNHDQVGNRAGGERLHHLVGERAAVVGAALVLTAPHVPLLFQGEEWAASSPFPFFCDFGDPELRAAVTAGRRREFAAFGWRPEDVPDPVAASTRDAAVLVWDERDAEPHAGVLGAYRQLLALRRGEPDLTDPTPRRCRAWAEGTTVVVERGAIRVAANLGAEAAGVALGPTAEILWRSDEAAQPDGGGFTLPPMSAVVLRAGRAHVT